MATHGVPRWVWVFPAASAIAAVLAWTVWCNTERGTWLGGILILVSGLFVVAFVHESLPHRRGFRGALGAWAVAFLAGRSRHRDRVPRRRPRLLPQVPAVLVRIAVVSFAALALVGVAQAGTVAVIVVAPFPPVQYAARGAVGLMPPGDGTTVSRDGALAALVRGRTEKALLGGVPGGRPTIQLARGRHR